MKNLFTTLLISLFIFSCDSDPVSPLDECGVSGGDNSTCLDDCGVVNGDSLSCLDECGIVNGDNSTCLGCDGIINSGLVNDQCGVCDGNNSTCLDECGVINGDTIEMCGSCDYVYIWDVCYNIETYHKNNQAAENRTHYLTKMTEFSFLQHPVLRKVFVKNDQMSCMNTFLRDWCFLN